MDGRAGSARRSIGLWAAVLAVGCGADPAGPDSVDAAVQVPDAADELAEGFAPPSEADWGAPAPAPPPEPEAAAQGEAPAESPPEDGAFEGARGAGFDDSLPTEEEMPPVEEAMPPVEEEAAASPVDEEGLPPVEPQEAAPAGGSGTGGSGLLSWDDRDDSSKVSREQLEFMRRQHPEAGGEEAEVPMESEVPVEEAEVPAAPAGFDFGAVGEKAPPVEAPVGDGSFSFGAAERAVPGIPELPLDTTGDIATGEIQIAVAPSAAM